MKPLYGHISLETAFLVRSYPYGSKRCRIRFWLEQSDTRGWRFVYQTENPKSLVWNKPKQGTYSLLAACMYLDEQEHVQCRTLTEYSSAQEALQFLKDFPETTITLGFKAFIIGKIALNKLKSAGEPFMKMNGQPIPVSETDREAGVRDLSIWTECREIAFKTPKT